jgi:hypothetical protein
MKGVRLKDEYDGPDGDLICKLVVMHGGYPNVEVIMNTFYFLNKNQKAWIDTLFPKVPYVLFRGSYDSIFGVIRIPNSTFISRRKEPFLIFDWSIIYPKETEFAINVPYYVAMSVYVYRQLITVSNVVSSYFSVDASIENDNQVSVYINRKQG